MEISVEKTSELERSVQIKIPEQTIAEQVQERLDKLRTQAKIDGFRPGRAPFRVIRQRFGNQVREEVVGEVMQSSYSEALAKEELRPAGQPMIAPVEAEIGKGLNYTATFEVFPDIEVASLEGLSVTKNTCLITETDVDSMLEKLRDQNKEWVGVERSAEMGDQLTIDFDGTIENIPFEGGKGEDFDIILGNGMMIKGFEEGLVGKKEGEAASLDLQFPDDYRNEELASKEVRFQITVKKVREGVLPEVDAEFMSKFGAQDGDLVSFKTDLKNKLETERERAVDSRFSSEIMRILVESNQFEIPSSMVADEKKRLGQQLAQEFMMRGMNPGQAGTLFEETLEERSKFRVRLGLLMAEIIKTEGFKADPDKVRRKIESLAQGYDDPSAVVKWYYDNPEQLQQIEGQCLEEEVVEWAVSKVQVNEVPISFDALMNPVQTAEQEEANS